MVQLKKYSEICSKISFQDGFEAGLAVIEEKLSPRNLKFSDGSSSLFSWMIFSKS
jgi:hypothetical protein